MASYDYSKIGFRFAEIPQEGDYHRSPKTIPINDRYFLTMSVVDRDGWTFADLVLHDLQNNTTERLKRYDSNESRDYLYSVGAPYTEKNDHGIGKYGECDVSVFGFHVFVTFSIRIDRNGTHVPHPYRETDMLKGRI